MFTVTMLTCLPACLDGLPVFGLVMADFNRHDVMWRARRRREYRAVVPSCLPMLQIVEWWADFWCGLKRHRRVLCRYQASPTTLQDGTRENVTPSHWDWGQEILKIIFTERLPQAGYLSGNFRICTPWEKRAVSRPLDAHFSGLPGSNSLTGNVSRGERAREDIFSSVFRCENLGLPLQLLRPIWSR
ncbi:hypothetical protein QBC35DRAFT_469333 [Podospora australis]|uniref:Uncharacterized protein n=1 Tax=Podospora australis TaxID=1536484 RepID=A0AAN6X6G4_9PEZI|nr:hypothetical protein QBC35DRAFT_469333 [Podospora australis]